MAPDLFSLDRFADGSGRSITAHDWATDHASGPPQALPCWTAKPDHAVVVVSSPVRYFPRAHRQCAFAALSRAALDRLVADLVARDVLLLYFEVPCGELLL